MFLSSARSPTPEGPSKRAREDEESEAEEMVGDEGGDVAEPPALDLAMEGSMMGEDPRMVPVPTLPSAALGFSLMGAAADAGR